MPFHESDYSAYVIEHIEGARWIVVRIRGSEYGLRLEEASALHSAIHSAFVRACDPTPLPAAEPIPPRPTPLPHRHRNFPLTLEDLESL